MEYGETFEECASREVLEECGVTIKPEDIKYIGTMNIMQLDVGYHNVGVYMVIIFICFNTLIVRNCKKGWYHLSKYRTWEKYRLEMDKMVRVYNLRKSFHSI